MREEAPCGSDPRVPGQEADSKDADAHKRPTKVSKRCQIEERNAPFGEDSQEEETTIQLCYEDDHGLFSESASPGKQMNFVDVIATLFIIGVSFCTLFAIVGWLARKQIISNPNQI